MAQESAPTLFTKLTEVRKPDEDLEAFYLSDRFADVQFVVEDKIFNGHRVILASRSPYFDSLLSDDSKNKITLDNVNVNLFQEILKYIYLGSLSLPEDSDGLIDLLKLAHEYSLTLLESFLAENISSFLNTENVCLTLNKATSYNLQELGKVCVQFIDEHIIRILENESIFMLTQQSIIEVIRRDAFPLPEIDIFKIVEKWCNVNRNKDSGVIGCVRLSLLSTDEIFTVVRPSKLVEESRLLTAVEHIMRGSLGQSQRETGLSSSCNIERTLLLLELPNEASLKNLDLKNLKSKIYLENVSTLLNTATLYDLNQLQEACLWCIDEEAEQFIEQDILQNLTKGSILKLISRDSFRVPERTIFDAVSKWCATNNDTDYALMSCIRFSLMSVQDIVSTVWSSGLVKDEILLEAIAEIIRVKKRSWQMRRNCWVDTNVAIVEGIVIKGTNTVLLLKGNQDVTKCAKGSNIVVDLICPYFINHIKMRLRDDNDTCNFSYSIEVSLDCENWKKVINYDRYTCRSIQHLYFDAQGVQYVRIVGKDNLELVNFEAYLRNGIPAIVNGIIRPESNVATIEMGAKCIEGNQRDIILNGKLNLEYTSSDLGGYIMIQLAQPYLISHIKLRFSWFGETSTIVTSMNKTDWEILENPYRASCWNEKEIVFSEKPVIFIRLSGMDQNLSLSISHFECY